MSGWEGGIGQGGLDPDRHEKNAAAIAEKAERGQHAVTVTTTWTVQQPGLAREAFDARVKRLKEAKRPHERDTKTLTLRWTEENGDVVELTYSEAGQ